MKLVCDKDMCAGCMACVNICGKNAITIEDTGKALNAIIDVGKCIGCDLCHKVCPQNHQPELQKPLAWYQGWTADPGIRTRAASGGAVSAIAEGFIKNGGCVAACVLQDGEFSFSLFSQPEDLVKMTGSRYAKSSPGRIYSEIRKILKQGRNVLFIGLPCQVAGLKNFVGENYCDRLYTIDLICHGSPSTELLKNFLGQYHLNLRNLDSLDFREKTCYGIRCNGKYLKIKHACDRYTLAFLKGFSFTENCYHCKYAGLNRISDVTLGDSWGSDLPPEEQKKGISLLLVQTSKGRTLVDNAALVLHDVDLRKAQQNNHNLSHAQNSPKRRMSFFSGLSQGRSFNRALFMAAPWDCLKQEIKALLLMAKVLK